MIKPDQIPDEVVKAVERLLNLYLVGGLTQSEGHSIGHALVEAAINAWPGMRMMVDIDTGDDAAIKLPLTQEPEA